MKRKTDNFNKFYNKKRNSAVKEEFRQEKKAAKKERKEGIERRFEEKRQAKALQQPPDRPDHAGKGHSGAGHAGAPERNTGAPQRNTGAPAPHNTQPATPDTEQEQELRGDLIPLNKYIAHGGICSRRDAAELIRLGKVLVNGQPVTEPGTKVAPTDLVKVNGKKVTISRNFVYILLNKPKDYITTTDDPLGRRTVLDLIRHATEERVFPVGRLDRNTSGVLLLTNDGDLSQKLAHPSHEIKKIYHVVLDKPLTKADFDKIIAGEVQLEDGAATVDAMAYEDTKDKTQIGLEIHSGRNRIVRRIFEHLGYDVRGLDRVMYAGLTKKNVQRGKWRLLLEKEVRILKYLNSSIKGSAARAKDWDNNQSDSFDSKRSAPGNKHPQSATGSKHTGPGAKTGKRTSPPPPPEDGRLHDPEGLLSESELSHFSKKKQGFSPYTKRPATGKRQGSDHSREDRPREEHSSRAGKRPRTVKPSFRDKTDSRDKAPFRDKRAPSGKPFTPKGPGAAPKSASTGERPRPGRPTAGAGRPTTSRPPKGKGRPSSEGRPASGRPQNASGRPSPGDKRPARPGSSPGGKRPRPGGAPRSNRKEK